MMQQLIKMQAELNRLFDLFNDHYYGGQLRRPIITIQSNGGRGRKRLSMGWCTLEKIWKDHATGDYYFEITVCSEYLYREISEICSTLLHEMVHLYCIESGIKDTSRGNTYHNKRFRDVAEAHGLTVTYDQKIGWSISELNPEAREFVSQNAEQEVFILTRIQHAAPKPFKGPVDAPEGEEGESPTEGPENGAEGITEGGFSEGKPKQSTRKYVCPKCGCIIRATREVNVLCGDCGVAFEKEGKKEDG